MLTDSGKCILYLISNARHSAKCHTAHGDPKLGHLSVPPWKRPATWALSRLGKSPMQGNIRRCRDVAIWKGKLTVKIGNVWRKLHFQWINQWFRAHFFLNDSMTKSAGRIWNMFSKIWGCRGIRMERCPSVTSGCSKIFSPKHVLLFERTKGLWIQSWHHKSGYSTHNQSSQTFEAFERLKLDHLRSFHDFSGYIARILHPEEFGHLGDSCLNHNHHLRWRRSEVVDSLPTICPHLRRQSILVVYDPENSPHKF